MSAPPIPAAAGPAAALSRSGDDRGRLHLVLVRTPGPPLEDERVPVRLLVPGRPRRRSAPPPGPRPLMDQPLRRPGNEPDFGPALSRRADLPEPGPAARRLVTIALEAFAGRRPMSQLQPAVTPSLFTVLIARRKPRWCLDGTTALRISSVRVSEPVDGVAEVSAVARRDGRAHAVAARMEGIDGRWRCTALQVG
ncbi:hypothetical protein SAMN05661080_00127 [Modestobacter sp. DSM 44400]|uniref:Rv3235 family protein n=1 Tax=Modestobacter sp. DSM 44400 TaxID=1550230 RepID=UPI00089CE62A|nr:Rv3235 family protein [Modestobacter sp. DSM 44400]SDX48690.1 hypothetical protein SAMN05661080_00127 [Modestobacter sp. DSM 44400]